MIDFTIYVVYKDDQSFRGLPSEYRNREIMSLFSTRDLAVIECNRFSQLDQSAYQYWVQKYELNEPAEIKCGECGHTRS